ncbi:MAG: TIM-barrel fold metal-dependent hydrolase [Actinomycetia bacterium]|nr:TIM-barrel fold metal-dependent hydrolase [Actinomycetes bacterium]
MIVDSHTHVMSTDTDRYPTRSDLGYWFHGAGDVASLLAAMDDADVDQAVLVQFVGGYGYDCTYAADAVAAGDGRLRLCVAVDMYGADPAADLRALATSASPQVVRVFGVGADDPVWLTDGRAAAVWAAAAETGIGIVATLWDRDLHHLRPLVEAHPAVTVAVDHCGFVDFSGDVSPLLDLADLPAVHVKISSHVLGPLEEPAVAVDLLADRFGADRLVWGSDYPQTEGTYAGMVELARRAARHLGEGERDDFLGGTARRLWFG